MKDSTFKQRIYKFDNIRFILISLVVLGHLLELIPGIRIADLLYRIIYSFHMPTMLFLSGYFAHFDVQKMLQKLAAPYVIFQVIYLLFATYVLGEYETLQLQFYRPYWILWYLLVMLYYYLLLPLLDFIYAKGIAACSIFFAFTVMLSLGCGYIPDIGYFLSLSRFLVFLPFFTGGYFARKQNLYERFASFQKNHYLVFGSVFIVMLSVCFIYQTQFLYMRDVFYGSYPYYFLQYTPLVRIVQLACSFSWIILLMHFLPDKQIPFITNAGKKTMPIYLLHGFLIRLLGIVI